MSKVTDEGGGVAVGLNLKSIFMLKKVNFVFAILPAASTYFVRAHTANPT